MITETEFLIIQAMLPEFDWSLGGGRAIAKIVPNTPLINPGFLWIVRHNCWNVWQQYRLITSNSGFLQSSVYKETVWAYSEHLEEAIKEGYPKIAEEFLLNQKLRDLEIEP